MLRQIDRRLPSGLFLFHLGFAAVSLALIFLKGLQDPDYFWHLRTGELIIESGLPSRDPFSFTYGGPWVLHEWLGEVVMAALDRAAGPAVSLGLFAVLLPMTFAGMSFALRRRWPDHALIAATLLCGAVAIPYATVRPQVFSWVFMGLLMVFLIRLRPGHWARLLWLPALFVLWANVHGVYVLGLGVLGLYVLATLSRLTPMAPDRWVVLGVLVGCVLAAGLTPAGLEGLTYPLRYVDASDWGLANIPEWQSPNFHDLVQIPLLLLIVAVAALTHPAGLGWVRVAAILSLIGALLANRNAPVAAVVTFPYIASAVATSGWRPRPSPGGARVLQALTVILVAGASLTILPTTAGWGGVTLDRYPVEGIRVLAREAPSSRIVVEYGWGGYVINEVYDGGGRVFVDGRNDMYPESLLHDYSALREAEPHWPSIAESHQIDAMLFPPDAPIVRGVAQDAGWCELVRDEREVLLLRHCPDGVLK